MLGALKSFKIEKKRVRYVLTYIAHHGSFYSEVCALKEGFKRVFDPNFRKPSPKTCQWYLGRIVNREVSQTACQSSCFQLKDVKSPPLGLNLDSAQCQCVSDFRDF